MGFQMRLKQTCLLSRVGSKCLELGANELFSELGKGMIFLFQFIYALKIFLSASFSRSLNCNSGLVLLFSSLPSSRFDYLDHLID